MLAPEAPAAAEEPSEPEAAVVPEDLDLGTGRAARHGRLSGRTYRYVERRQPVDVYRPDRTLHFDEGLPVDGALNAVDVLDLGGNQESRGASARGDGGERRLDVWG